MASLGGYELNYYSYAFRFSLPQGPNFRTKSKRSWGANSYLFERLNVFANALEEGRRELLETQGQNCEMRPLASRNFFRSRPLDWLEIYFRAFLVVKIPKIFNHEAP